MSINCAIILNEILKGTNIISYLEIGLKRQQFLQFSPKAETRRKIVAKF
jgi:hypothetical protein